MRSETEEKRGKNLKIVELSWKIKKRKSKKQIKKEQSLIEKWRNSDVNVLERESENNKGKLED